MDAYAFACLPGIDQNPVYYEFMAAANFRTAPVPDIAAWAVDRAHRRYGLTTLNQNVRCIVLWLRCGGHR